MLLSYVLPLRKLILLFFTFFFINTAFSQSDSASELTEIFEKIDFFSETENYDSIIFYFEKALPIATAEEDKKEILTELGYYYSLLENYEKSGSFFKQALNYALEKTPSDSLFISDQYYYTAYTYYQKGDLNEALDYYKKSLETNSPKANFSDYAQTLSSVAAIYGKKSDYDHALIYEKKALDIFDAQNDLPGIASTQNSIALSYYFKQDYEIALKFILEAISYHENKNSEVNPNSFIPALSNYALILIKLEKFDLAYATLEKAIHLQKTSGEKRYEHIIQFNRAFFEYETQNFETALIEFEKALKIYIEKFPKGHTNIGKAHYYIGQIQAKKQQHQLALQSYQKALQKLVPNFKNNNLTSNPQLDQYCRSHRNLLRILTAKANILGKVYFSNNNKDSISESLILDTYNLAIEVSENLRQSYKAEGSQYFLAEETEALFNQAVEFSYQLYEQTSDFQYLEKAHFYVEKNQSPILLQNHRAIEGQKIGGVPASFIQQEKQLCIDLAFYKNEQSLAIEKDHKKKAQLYGDYVFSYSQQLDSLRQQLKLKYPRYFEHQYGSKIVAIPDLQRLLSEDQLLIQYYLTEKGIYAFAFSKETSNFIKIQDANAIQIITTDFLNALKNPLNKRLSKELAFQQMTETSHQLYQQLLAPLLNNLPQQPARLAIIANGFLTKIPFETLLSKPTNEKSNYLNLDYLINQFAISYQSSASLMQQLQTPKTTRASEEILAVAPFANSSKNPTAFLRSSLGDLPYSKNEIENLSPLFNTKILLQNEAQKATFLATASNYKILHLATHGEADFDNPSHSRLFFYPSNSEDSTSNILFNYEIQNLQLNADLAVLSACETGAGKVDKGEGILSLARGFFYTGVPSLFMSKWQINDQSSSLIINELYKNLKENTSKDKALQTAKITYLQNEADLVTAHPFYWAGMVQLGNATALNFQQTNWWFWGGGIFLILILFIVFLKIYYK